MKYFCCDEFRRDKLKGQNPSDPQCLNGIDFLEVLDDKSLPDKERQRILLVSFIFNKGLGSLKTANVRIEGGTRVRNPRVEWAYVGNALPAGKLTPKQKAFLPTSAEDLKRLLVVRTNSTGDFSRYTLRIVQDAEDPENFLPPSGFDPILSAVDFTFKAGCPSEFDCKPRRICPPQPSTEPEINYLAKDYASFRQLMLDRLALLAPKWDERNPADLGITLVEWLSYVADQLSYEQDAVATEAYLSTARRRISVRRHARLVDYPMHDGCNARAWIQVKVDGGSAVTVKKGTRFLAYSPEDKVAIPTASFSIEKTLADCRIAFESMHDATLFKDHSILNFYTWGNERCCLPAGATKATLKGHLPELKAGDVLVFAEAKNPRSGEEPDADRTRRHPVLLTRVVSEEPGAPGTPLKDKLYDETITEIEWGSEDKLPFPFCISSITDREYGSKEVADASVALGNIILADHGLTLENEVVKDGDTASVPKWEEIHAPTGDQDRCSIAEPQRKLPHFRPTLNRKPLTVSVRLDNGTAFSASFSAAKLSRVDLRSALPDIKLIEKISAEEWTPDRDLLNCGKTEKVFVVEQENDGTAIIRFGDNAYGAFPDSGLEFQATYRVGNGAEGNIGADTLKHIVSDDGRITSVSNPLPAVGGIDREPLERVRQRAPFAFRRQERAVTADDYTEVAKRYPGIQNAVATFRWTGSWYTVFLTVDRQGGAPVDKDFKKKMKAHLEKYRLAGYDLVVDSPRFVSLEIVMHVCVKPGFFREDVKEALLGLFSSGQLADGRLGVFHPDKFTFGQPVYLSRVYEAALGVDGVQSVEVTKFQRQGQDSTDACDEGLILLRRTEIARLDNDPNFPDHGVIRFEMGGGQ